MRQPPSWPKLTRVLRPTKFSIIFGRRKAVAQQKYREFVQDGTGSSSLWDELEAQSLLGVEGFAEGLRHLVTEKQQIREVSKRQRFIDRPTLEKLFAQRTPGKSMRDRLIAKAVSEFGSARRFLFGLYVPARSCCPISSRNFSTPRASIDSKLSPSTPGVP